MWMTCQNANREWTDAKGWHARSVLPGGGSIVQDSAVDDCGVDVSVTLKRIRNKRSDTQKV